MGWRLMILNLQSKRIMTDCSISSLKIVLFRGCKLPLEIHQVKGNFTGNTSDSIREAFNHFSEKWKTFSHFKLWKSHRKLLKLCTKTPKPPSLQSELALLHDAAAARTDLHLGLDPGPDDVGLVGKLSTQTLVVLLSGVFLDQGLVALRHQLPHLQHTHKDTHDETRTQCLNPEKHIKSEEEAPHDKGHYTAAWTDNFTWQCWCEVLHLRSSCKTWK